SVVHRSPHPGWVAETISSAYPYACIAGSGMLSLAASGAAQAARSDGLVEVLGCRVGLVPGVAPGGPGGPVGSVRGTCAPGTPSAPTSGAVTSIIVKAVKARCVFAGRPGIRRPPSMTDATIIATITTPVTASRPAGRSGQVASARPVARS